MTAIQIFVIVMFYTHRGEDNTWIIKPWNLARGMDTFILDKLAPIIRLGLASPKVVCMTVHHFVCMLARVHSVCVRVRACVRACKYVHVHACMHACLPACQV